jgi:hypothetical protein
MTTYVRIVDLCGREPPRVVELLSLDADDVDHILDMFADGNAAFIGEHEYRPATADELEPLDDE